MKIRYILAFLITIFCNLCFAQNVEVGSFGTTGASWNSNNTILQIKRDANTVFQTNILVLRSNLPGITSRPLKAEARVIFINKLDGDWAIVSPVLEFTNSDFNSSSGASNVKSVTTTIPKDFLYSPAKGELTVQWRYYKDGYPYPDNVNGWTTWYQSQQKINCELAEIVTPPTTFTGPSSICTDGTYTITNPGTISLENASGIATLTALGNNQWKVTRINSGNGVVKLKSTKSDKSYEYEIKVGGNINLGIESMISLQDSPSGNHFTVIAGIGNYKYSGVLTVKNSNNSIPTTYSWTKIGGTSGVPPITWSSNANKVVVESKGVGGNIILRCTVTSGCAVFTKDYTFYMGFSPD